MTTTRPPGPVDCCPSCSTAVLPHDAEHDPGGMRAFYECPSGHRWWKGWLLSEEEMAMYRTEAA